MLIDESMFIIVTVPDPHAITGIGTGLLDIATGEIKHARNIDYYGTFSSWSVVSVDGYEHGDELYRYTSKAA
ncbi:MAG: hypothetical protein JWM36_4335 [Hyphomicrobiales bacterium]|nr:hypothetical protein [Hyphomicrobiales bacterium]